MHELFFVFLVIIIDRVNINVRKLGLGKSVQDGHKVERMEDLNLLLRFHTLTSERLDTVEGSVPDGLRLRAVL